MQGTGGGAVKESVIGPDEGSGGEVAFVGIVKAANVKAMLDDGILGE